MNVSDTYIVDGIIDEKFNLKDFVELLMSFKGYSFYVCCLHQLDEDNNKWVNNVKNFIKNNYNEYYDLLEHKYIWEIERHIFGINGIGENENIILNKSAIN